MTRFAFPPRWHYDILHALDYFRGAGAEGDPRLSEAIVEMAAVGLPIRWITLRAMRV